MALGAIGTALPTTGTAGIGNILGPPNASGAQPTQVQQPGLPGATKAMGIVGTGGTGTFGNTPLQGGMIAGGGAGSGVWGSGPQNSANGGMTGALTGFNPTNVSAYPGFLSTGGNMSGWAGGGTLAPGSPLAPQGPPMSGQMTQTPMAQRDLMTGVPANYNPQQAQAQMDATRASMGNIGSALGAALQGGQHGAVAGGSPMMHQIMSQLHPQTQQALKQIPPQALQQLHQAGLIHPQLMQHLNGGRQ